MGNVTVTTGGYDPRFCETSDPEQAVNNAVADVAEGEPGGWPVDDWDAVVCAELERLAN